MLPTYLAFLCVVIIEFTVNLSNARLMTSESYSSFNPDMAQGP
jgi:hypothetical protein